MGDVSKGSLLPVRTCGYTTGDCGRLTVKDGRAHSRSRGGHGDDGSHNPFDGIGIFVGVDDFGDPGKACKETSALGDGGDGVWVGGISRTLDRGEFIALLWVLRFFSLLLILFVLLMLILLLRWLFLLSAF